MQEQHHLLPSLKTDFIDKETGELKVRYRSGFPRSYRFDASRGIFVIGEKPITQRGESLNFIPIGYRIFQDEIMGLDLKKWVEFFFLNQAGHVCSLLFHGFSVESLERKTNDLFYDEVNLTEVQLTVKPIEKIKKSGEGKGSKYFIAEFDYKILNTQERADIKLLGESLPLFRNDTLTGNALMELSVHYCPPVHLTEVNATDQDIPELGITNSSS